MSTKLGIAKKGKEKGVEVKWREKESKREGKGKEEK